jgi:hypothetical protein
MAFTRQRGVHPVLARAELDETRVCSSDQNVFGFVDCQDLQLEEPQIPETVRLAFHRLDLVVGPFHRPWTKEAKS